MSLLEDRALIGRLEQVERVVGHAVAPDLEVHVGPGGVPAAPHRGDELPGLDVVPDLDQILHGCGRKG